MLKTELLMTKMMGKFFLGYFTRICQVFGLEIKKLQVPSFYSFQSNKKLERNYANLLKSLSVWIIFQN